MKYETNIKPNFEKIEELIFEGIPEVKICNKFDVSYSAWIKYKRDNKEFRDLIAKAWKERPEKDLKKETLKKNKNIKRNGTMFFKMIELIKYLRKKDIVNSDEILKDLNLSHGTLRYYVRTLQSTSIGIKSRSGNKSNSGYYIPELLTEAEKKELKKLDEKLFEKIISLLERVI